MTEAGVFHIVTSGQGMLPAGVTVGFVEADSAQEAEEALLASGQIPAHARGHFDYIDQPK